MSRIPFKERPAGLDRVPVLSYRRAARVIMRDYAMTWREARLAGKPGNDWLHFARIWRNVSQGQQPIATEAE